MNTLQPNILNTTNSNSNKKSLSICQSKRLIDDLENSLNIDDFQEQTSNYFINRQISTGMIMDMKHFDNESKIKKQLLCKNGEEDEGIIFSFMVLKEQKGEPLQIIYRWIRKPKNGLTKAKETVITEQEHIYQGGMKQNRKHGSGQYIIIQKLSNATEKQVRYKGKWEYDIFNQGTIENEHGQIKQIKSIGISLKSKTNLKGKPQRNATIKNISAQMGKKRSAKEINVKLNESYYSVRQKILQVPSFSIKK